MTHEHQLPNERALADQLATDIAKRLSDAIAERGQALLCVSGGKSPIPLFEALSKFPISWQHVTITLVDERCVPASHPDSNAALVQRHLLTNCAAAARFLPWPPQALPESLASTPNKPWAEQAGERQQWAESVEAALRPLWPADVVVLGMGMDGHTASLFSQAQGVDQALNAGGHSLCAALRPPHAPHDRLTLTLSALLSSRHVALQISGAAKSHIYQLAREKAARGRPVSLLLSQARSPVSVWMGA
jgi:6-phosphogluconolactonase